MRKKIQLPNSLKTIVESGGDADRSERLRTAITQMAGANRDTNIITQVRRYKLITPLFGGGVEPGVNDDLTPISGKAIRGHLRFWWRATRGGQFRDGDQGLQAMKDVEARLFGAASTKETKSASIVQIDVVDASDLTSNETKREKPYVAPKQINEKWKKALAYAAFPFQDNPQNVTYNIEFTVKFSFVRTAPDRKGRDIDVETEINAALWAWETFGGVGARTRRGFGALTVTTFSRNGEDQEIDLPQTTRDVRTWIEGKLKHFAVKGKWHGDVSHLSVAATAIWLKITLAKPKGETSSPSPVQVWEYLIGKLKGFRQARFNKNEFLAGRRKRDDVHGISHWPEANEIRRQLKITAKIVDTKTPRRFPRAKMGLPINFHLPHDTDQPTAVLRASSSKRRASPLILRPLTCGDGHSVGIACVLEPTKLPPGNLILEGLGPVDAELNNLPVGTSPIEPLRKQTDPLQVFLSTIS